MKVSQLINEQESRLKEIQQHIRILALLPTDLNVRGISTEMLTPCITVQGGSFEDLLEELPPSNAIMTRRGDRWHITPEAKPVSFEQRFLPIIESEDGLMWFHYLSDGTVIRVRTAGLLPKVEGYDIMHAFGGRVLVRKLRKLLQVHPEVAEQDKAAWNAFYDRENYTAAQRHFADTVALLASYNRYISIKHLPHPADVSANPKGLFTSSALVEFWNAFTPESAQRLVDFAGSMTKDKDIAQWNLDRESMTQVRRALAEFQLTHMRAPVANAVNADTLKFWIAKQTQLLVSITLGTYSREKGTWHLKLTLNRVGDEFVLTSPHADEEFDPQGFDFLNAPFLEYEPNPGYIF